MKKLFRVLGIAAIVIVLAVCLVAGLGILFVATASDIPVTDADKQVVVRASELAPWFEDFTPAAKFESFGKIQYLDQSRELTYEYDSPKDDEPYIIVTVSHEGSPSDAQITFQAEWSGQRLGLNIADSDMDMEETNSFYSVGDQSRFANITSDGEVVGHVLVARHGTSVYAFSIAGFTMEDATMWSELFDDRVNNLASDE